MMKKIVTIIGARPQFIKAAIFSKAISKCNLFNEIIIHTGQHYDHDMSDIFFTQMSIPSPKYNLNIVASNHGEMTGLQIIEIEKCLIIEKPDFVLVYGDTNSTLAGALAAVKLHIPIIHIEAGLRSFNNKMPEEINRILTDRISTFLFAPTDNSVKNLISEGMNPQNIFQVGDIMLDSTLFFKEYSRKPIWFDVLLPIDCKFVLCTIHRAENTDNPIALNAIFDGLSHCPITIVLPLHPRTKKRLLEFGIKVSSNIKIVSPVGFLEMLWLQKKSEYIITDSGGLQKEAYFQKKFCITLRDETEWTELVHANYNLLVGADKNKIISAVSSIIPEITTNDLYGEGKTGDHIVKILTTYLSEY